MILCCGEALIDMLPRDTTQGETAFAPYAGGAVFNTASGNYDPIFGERNGERLPLYLAVSARLGSRPAAAQYSGQPFSYCGHSPCSTKPRSCCGSHWAAPRESPSALHQAAFQLSART